MPSPIRRKTLRLTAFDPHSLRKASDVQIQEKHHQAPSIPWAHLRIPPFPQVAIRVLQLSNNEDAPIRQLADLISSDPSFSSEVLTIANSALYARRAPVNSILEATAVLGVNSLKGVCLTVGVRAYLGKSLNHESLRAIWRHSLACALVAEQLADPVSLNKEAAYTAGVLHDIGRLALAVMRPEHYAKLLMTHRGSSNSFLQSERELFGMDHCEAGKRLLSSWKLPRGFEAIVANHHAQRQRTDKWDSPALINVSCRLADAIGFAVSPGCDVTPYAEVVAELPEPESKRFATAKDTLAFEVSSKINAVELC
jgi:putative nucleotidyltransferase with HDIG domain